jgi:hypothetical protein
MDFTTGVNRCQLLIRPLKDLLDRAVVTHRADWRCHKFPARVQVLQSMAARLDQGPSGRALIEELNDLDCQGHDRQHRQLVDFDHLDYWGQPLTINQSSWSRANAARSWHLWRYLFHRLLALARTALSPAQPEGLSSLVN